jgi:hypothetical protein
VKFNRALVIREHKGKVFYEAKWRDATGRQVKRRVGEAWLSETPPAHGGHVAAGSTAAAWTRSQRSSR